MYATSTLATRFASNSPMLRSAQPLTEDQMRSVAPSVFAEGKHASRSERYTYIPTIDVLRGLKREGFEPFMVAQGRSRVEGKAEFTKHMIRLRSHQDIGGPVQTRTRPEVNEIILINSHDGASCYRMTCGAFRFICMNGLIVGDVTHDIRVPHTGDALGQVIDGAFRVVDDFEAVDASIDGMKSVTLKPDEERAMATAALALRYGERGDGQPPAPVTADQLIEARRPEDLDHSVWTVMNRIQENVQRGGQPGRSATGRRMHTRPIANIDRTVSLNRALWILAEEMRKLKA